jgi:hypothetical protein
MLHFRYAQIKSRVESLIVLETAHPPSFCQIVIFVLSNRDGLVRYQPSGVEEPMYSTESPPLQDEYPQRDIDASDLDAERASSNRVHRLRPDSAYPSSGFKAGQFRNGRPSVSRQLTRSFARYFVVVLIAVGATLAWQSYGGEMVRAWAPSLGWLFPTSPSAELQAQLKPVALDLAIMKRTIEQLASNQDQLARKQDQMTQAFVALQTAEQDINQNILALAPLAPKAGRASPKPQPSAQ